MLTRIMKISGGSSALTAWPANCATAGPHQSQPRHQRSHRRHDDDGKSEWYLIRMILLILTVTILYMLLTAVGKFSNEPPTNKQYPIKVHASQGKPAWWSKTKHSALQSSTVIFYFSELNCTYPGSLCLVWAIVHCLSHVRLPANWRDFPLKTPKKVTRSYIFRCFVSLRKSKRNMI